MNKFNFARLVFAFGGFCLNILLGSNGKELSALMLLMIVDYITGLMCGFRSKNLSSSIGFNGILKKIAILCLIMVAGVVDIVIGASVAKAATIFFYIGNEGISVVENSIRLGLPVPDLVRNSLEQIVDDKHRSGKECNH